MFRTGDGIVNPELMEELAALLDVDRQEATSLFNGFCTAMVAELLAGRKLSVKGLGTFSVAHIPATKKSTGSAIIFAPPVTKLRYESCVTTLDDTVHLAAERLAMSKVEAARFGKSLATLLADALRQESNIILHGLGRFALEEGAYRFFPDHTLEELLNREHQDLKEIVLPHQESPGEEQRIPGYLLPLSSVILLAVLYGQYAGRISFPSLPVFSKGAPAVLIPAKGVSSALLVTPTAKAVTGGGTADSLLLAKGDYAIVLATFESEKRARTELAPLRSAGIKAFVWPAFMDGVEYFRLMTGRFATREAAAEQLRGIPKKVVSGAYIQQVKKTVVVHGEKGL